MYIIGMVSYSECIHIYYLGILHSIVSKEGRLVKGLRGFITMHSDHFPHVSLQNTLHIVALETLVSRYLDVAHPYIITTLVSRYLDVAHPYIITTLVSRYLDVAHPYIITTLVSQ